MQLLGYIVRYSCMDRTTESRFLTDTHGSRPFSRPMWWDYGYDAVGREVDEAWAVPSQYLFGDVLVNPVTNWVDPKSSTMNTTALTTANKTTWLPKVRDRSRRRNVSINFHPQ